MSEKLPQEQAESNSSPEHESLGSLLEKFDANPTETLNILADRIDASSNENVSDKEFTAVMTAAAVASIGGISLVGGASPQEARLTVGLLGKVVIGAVGLKSMSDQYSDEPLKRSTFVGPKIAIGLRRLAEALKKEGQDS